MILSPTVPTGTALIRVVGGIQGMVSAAEFTANVGLGSIVLFVTLLSFFAGAAAWANRFMRKFDRIDSIALDLKDLVVAQKETNAKLTAHEDRERDWRENHLRYDHAERGRQRP